MNWGHRVKIGSSRRETVKAIENPLQYTRSGPLSRAILNINVLLRRPLCSIGGLAAFFATCWPVKALYD